MPDPKLAVIDIPEVDTVLARAAKAMALNMNLDLKLERTAPVTLRFLQGLYGKSGPIAAQAQFDDAKTDRDALDFHRLFRTRFREAAGRGPAAMLTYLNEKLVQADHALASIQYKFSAANDVNAEALKQINTEMDRAQRLKTGAELCFLFLGTFGAGSLTTGVLTWRMNTAAGAVVTLVTEIANTIGQVQEAGVVTYAKGGYQGLKNTFTTPNLVTNTVGGLGNKAQELTGDAEKRAGALLQELEQQNERLLQAQRSRIQSSIKANTVPLDNISRRATPLTAQQMRNIETAASELNRGMKAELQAEASFAAGRSLALTVKGVSFLVGLAFMHENLEKAWKGQTAWEQEQVDRHSKELREKAAAR